MTGSSVVTILMTAAPAPDQQQVFGVAAFIAVIRQTEVFIAVVQPEKQGTASERLLINIRIIGVVAVNDLLDLDNFMHSAPKLRIECI